MKPHPNNGRRVASSDVREYKISIRGDKVAPSHILSGKKWREGKPTDETLPK